MNANEIATEIYTELGSPTDLSVSQIEFWLLANIGQVNLLIDEAILVESDEFVPELTSEQKEILKTLYYVKWATTGMQSNLGAAGYDWSELSEGDSKIRRVSRNEVAKNYKQLRDSYYEYLNTLAFFYKKNKITPGSYDLRKYIEVWRYENTWI